MLAYVRQVAAMTVTPMLCVNNLSRFLAHRIGLAAMDQLHAGRADRARGVSTHRPGAYLLTLPGHGFYWYS